MLIELISVPHGVVTLQRQVQLKYIFNKEIWRLTSNPDYRAALKKKERREKINVIKKS